MRPNEHGFTLIEMMLSVAIIGLLAGLSLPVFLSFQTNNDLSQTTEVVADTLRRAETYSRANYGDAQWGVDFASRSVTLFQGATFSGRNTAFDEPETIPSDVLVGFSGDIIFNKLSGLPASSASINLTSTGGSSSTLTINNQGMVNY